MSFFPQFISFPLEIQALVLDSCPLNDQTCLRLTCKSLYYLSTTITPIPLDNIDLQPQCNQVQTVANIPSWMHCGDCHKISYDAYCKRLERSGRKAPPFKARCRRQRSGHCECYTWRTKLHFRLRSWMPKGLNYCGECQEFTKRKRQHNGKCYHGKPKDRKCESKYWTHRSRRGAFGEEIWKKWFNNRAMNSLEKRLSLERSNRKGSDRYALRELRAQDVDTKMERDNHS